MSHGGMSGGGGGGHGHSGGFGLHGHSGHGGYGGGMGGHHADQSPLWSMAMQVGQDPSKRLRIADPRILVAITLFVFVALASLPYTMDYLQHQRLAKKNGEELVVAEDSQGPSSAALAVVGSMPTPVAAPRAASGAPDVFGAPQVAAQSARDTVSQMAAASGLAPSAGAGYTATSAAPLNYGASVIPAQAANYSYGGAVRANDQYYVYMPGQAPQLGQAEPAMQSQGHSPRMAALPTMAARPAAIDRSPFNPRTSAISSPMGMRSHSADPTVPLVPSATDGAHRMRVWVPR